MALPATKSHVRPWNTDEIRAKLSRLNCDPVMVHAAIVMNEMPCLACQHTPGRERYVMPTKQQGKQCKCVTMGGAESRCWRCDGTGLATMADRVCQSCHGIQREMLTVGAVQHSADELMRYTCQQLKQVDHVSSDGSQVTGIRIISVAANAVREGTSPARLMESHERSNSGD